MIKTKNYLYELKRNGNWKKILKTETETKAKITLRYRPTHKRSAVGGALWNVYWTWNGNYTDPG